MPGWNLVCQNDTSTKARSPDFRNLKKSFGAGPLKNCDNLFASYVFSWWCWDTFGYEPKPWTWTSSLKHFREHFVCGELNGTKVNGPITVFLIDDLPVWRSFCSTQQPPNTFQWLWNHPTRCCTLFEHKGFLSQAAFWPKSFGKITYEQIKNKTNSAFALNILQIQSLL